MKWNRFAAAVLTAACAASSAPAAVIVSLDNVVVRPGQQAVVGVYLTSTSNDVVTGFNLPFDVNNDGYVDNNDDQVGDLPAGFTYATPTPLRNALYDNTGYDMPQPQITLFDIDAIPTGSGSDVRLSATPTKLFDLAFNVAADVPVGTVLPMRIEDLDAPFTGVFTIAGRPSPIVLAPTPGAPVYGSITVADVPEPAALATLAAATAGLTRRRRSS